MHKKIAKLDRDFHKFLALLGLTTQHYGHRHRSKIKLTKRALPASVRARGTAADPTGHGAARAKSQRDRPLRALNRGTWAPGVGDVDAIEFKSRDGERKRRYTAPSGRDRRVDV